MRAGISNLSEISRRLRDMSNAPQRVIDATIGDFKSRAPGWISQEVTKEYNIKKAEVMDTMSAQGSGIREAKIISRGRLLTHTHFSMTPTEPPGRNKNYTTKVQIKKGARKTLGRNKKLTKKQRKNIGKNFTRQGTKNSPKSPAMLLDNGSQKVEGVKYIPFQRRSQQRNDLVVKRAIAIPQMITNEKVSENIYQAIEEKLGKRLDHYLQRFMR